MIRTAAALTAMIAATPAVAQDSYNGYETPAYTVVAQDGPYEMREYSPSILAEVTVKSERSQALRQGFRVLAGYIFGGNTSADKVAMTTPVAQTPAESIAMTTPVTQTGESGLWTVSFMMPREYTLDSLPTPDSNAIRFRQTPPDTQVVLRFSGWATQSRLTQHEADLRRYAIQAGLSVKEPVRHYYYDDPMTLPWKRRNEVAFSLQ